jgi:hypothetical protein
MYVHASDAVIYVRLNVESMRSSSESGRFMSGLFDSHSVIATETQYS